MSRLFLMGAVAALTPTVMFGQTTTTKTAVESPFSAALLLTQYGEKNALPSTEAEAFVYYKIDNSQKVRVYQGVSKSAGDDETYFADTMVSYYNKVIDKTSTGYDITLKADAFLPTSEASQDRGIQSMPTFGVIYNQKITDEVKFKVYPYVRYHVNESPTFENDSGSELVLTQGRGRLDASVSYSPSALPGTSMALFNRVQYRVYEENDGKREDFVGNLLDFSVSQDVTDNVSLSVGAYRVEWASSAIAVGSKPKKNTTDYAYFSTYLSL